LALILVLLFGSILIGRRQENGFRNIFSISETQNNDNQLSEYGVSSKNLITHIDRMLENGARTDRNEAEVLTAAYITDTLQKYGFSVSEEATATDLVTISDQNTAFEFYARGVFFHQQQVDPDEIVSGEIAFVPLNYALPPAKTVFGKILLIETSEEDQDFFAETAKKIVQNYDLNALQAVIFIKPTPEEMVLLTNYADGKAIASFKIGANITATLPGKKNPDQEIWITTHFDTAGETPGANYAAAGSAILLELARLLQADQPDSTIRLIAFSQSATHSGAVTFMNVHQNDLSKVKVVLDLDQLGMWDTLLVSNSLATGETLESIGEEDLKKLKEDGQFYLRSNWYRFINLDQPDFPEWLEALKTNKMGLSESPPVYFKMVVETAAALEIPIQKSSLPCIEQGPLLAGGFPAVGLCGQGNDIAGTAYDDRSNIDQDKLYKSATLAYASILAFVEKNNE
jgi:hypothetical protein